MDRIAIRLPALLAQVMGGARDFAADGRTVDEALNDLVRHEPALAMHLFDDAGLIRRHILIIHNDEHVRARDALGRLLRPGDTLIIANAVSGG